MVTCGGSEFVFVLNASLPYHMLAACAESLPRPSWERELYVIVSLIMRSVFSHGRQCSIKSTLHAKRHFILHVCPASSSHLVISSVLCFCWCLPRPTWRRRAYGSLSRDVCQWSPTPPWRRGDRLISGKLCKFTVIQSKCSH